jgi:hypothetical protein
VDDIMLHAQGAHPDVVARDLSTQLQTVRQWMQDNSMKLNPAKDQLYAPTEAGRKAWEAAVPDYAGAVARVATDLGTTQRTRQRAGRQRETRLGKAQKLAHRIAALPIQREHKAQMAGAMLLGGSLYGTELDQLTAKQTQQLRQYMAHAMWDDRSGRNRQFMLLLAREGQLDPAVSMGLRFLTAWGRILDKGCVPEGLADYWGTLPERPACPAGPVARLRQQRRHGLACHASA